MNRDLSTPPQRIDAWRNAAWYALVAAAIALVVIKMFTGIVFLTAMLFALAVFMIAFAWIIRLTPKR